MRHIEQSIRVVQMLGVKRPTGRAVLMAVDDYVLGYCLRAAARERMTVALEAAGERGGAPGGRRVPAAELDPELAAALDAGELPLVKRLFGRRDRRYPVVPPDSSFEPGLRWLLDGIEAEAAQTGRSEGRSAGEGRSRPAGLSLAPARTGSPRGWRSQLTVLSADKCERRAGALS